MMRYLSVCSGIEAATLAWHPLGWQAAGFAEIEDFPRAVLKHHYPAVPLHGRDRLKGEPLEDYAEVAGFQTIGAKDYGPIDLLVGGTPCQSFSIAGLRGGLADDRGNLALEFLRLAQRQRPRWLVWENVPGVLSSNGGRDFGAIVAGMVDCGYGIAYRVLDAQYVRVDGFERAVPQRRRRVFVVGYLGDWRRAAAVLFERQGLSGNPAPRRETGEGLAPTISARPTGGGGLGTDFDLDGGLVHAPLVAPTIRAGGNKTGGDRPPGTDVDTLDSLIAMHCPPVSPALKARDYKGPSSDGDGDGAPLVAHSLRGTGFDASEDGTARGTPIVPTFAIQHAQIGRKDGAGPQGKGFQQDVSFTLDSRPAADAIAFDCKASGRNGFGVGDTSPTLRAMGHSNSHQNAGGQVAVAFSIMPMNSGKDYKARETDVSQPVMAGGPTGGNQGGDYVAQQSAVRRLTPVECERLQGMPDNYTRIPWRGKAADQCPDGPRYKAIGNSMAVNCMRWIGQRIAMVEALL